MTTNGGQVSIYFFDPFIYYFSSDEQSWGDDMSKRAKALKMNCWEYMASDRHRGGDGQEGCAQCPVPQMSNYDGINGGTNGGRACWIITGTLCDRDVQLTFAHKLATCIKCDFYMAVTEEEGKGLCLPIDIIEQIFNERSGPRRRKTRPKR